MRICPRCLISSSVAAETAATGVMSAAPRVSAIASRDGFRDIFHSCFYRRQQHRWWFSWLGTRASFRLRAQTNINLQTNYSEKNHTLNDYSISNEWPHAFVPLVSFRRQILQGGVEFPCASKQLAFLRRVSDRFPPTMSLHSCANELKKSLARQPRAW